MSRVRVAEPGDADALARLRWEFRAALGRPEEAEPDFQIRCARWMRERLGRDGAWRCWLAAEGEQPVGTVWLQVIEKLPNPVAERERHGYLSSLYVRPAHRGRGLGSELLGTCLAAGDALGVDAVILWPTPESRGLYLRHGFSATDDLMQRRPGVPVSR
jgi:GNAT superfamily N-acetyltransferase